MKFLRHILLIMEAVVPYESILEAEVPYDSMMEAVME